jgi:hypothetical protein
MAAVDADPSLVQARDHLAMALRLRASASRLKTPQARAKLARLAILYEELSLCYLEHASPTERLAN